MGGFGDRVALRRINTGVWLGDRDGLAPAPSFKKRHIICFFVVGVVGDGSRCQQILRRGASAAAAGQASNCRLIEFEDPKSSKFIPN